MKFDTGDTVGAYRIIGVLGRGGMGRVYRVEHTITRRVEAMKVLADGRSTAQEQAARFQREIQVQASLTHPNIAPVHNAFWVDDDLVMIMELVEGESLQALLERGRVPFEIAIEYACQMLSALGYAHARGVVHRDVTPGNMIVTHEGIVKLTDFGLAKAPTDVRLTASGDVLGSAFYMSPEQVRGSMSVDEKTDIYSAGAVLYELVTGCKPFPGTTAFTVMQAHVSETAVAPTMLDPNLPPALDQIVLTALAKSPDERHKSAEVFREALLLVPRGLAAIPAVPSKPAAAAQTALTGLSAVLANARITAASIGMRRLAAFGIGFAAVLLAVLVATLWQQGVLSVPASAFSKAAPSRGVERHAVKTPGQKPAPLLGSNHVVSPPAQWTDSPKILPETGPTSAVRRPAPLRREPAADKKLVAAPILPPQGVRQAGLTPAPPLPIATPPRSTVESARATPALATPAPRPPEQEAPQSTATVKTTEPAEPAPATTVKRRRNFLIRALGRVVAPLQKKDTPQKDTPPKEP